MCGIFGVAVTEGTLGVGIKNRARRARDVLAHRGPDEKGEWASGSVFLGHRRLSIVDLSERGRQPMVSEDGRVAIAVNGEIYNHRHLRRLIGTEHFRSNSDSEVILHGYLRWGIEGLLQRIEGIFAIAIVDLDRARVFLARDHFGVKPMYLSLAGGKWVWGSELKAIRDFLEPGELERDETALYDFLTYRYIPSPKTLYKDCWKIEPAHFVEIDIKTNRQESRRYWNLSVDSMEIDLDSAAGRLRELVAESVDEQLMSDVPVGFFLSGGLDSSIVVSSAAAAGCQVNSFSIGYDIARHDETDFARTVADAFSSRHRTKILSHEIVGDLLGLMERLYDEPFGDTSALPTYHVSGLASGEVKVVLTGDGGDELFGGYSWYRRFDRIYRLQSLFPRALFGSGPLRLSEGKRGLIRKILSRLDLFSRFDQLELYCTLLSGSIASEKQDVARELGVSCDYDDLWHFRRYYRPELPVLKRLQYLDFHTFLPDDILTKVDRASMAVSLEARVPLLCKTLAEYAFSLPESLLYHNGQLKGLLKHAYKGILPGTILHREKRGFSIPIHAWDRSYGESIRAFHRRALARYTQAQ